MRQSNSSCVEVSSGSDKIVNTSSEGLESPLVTIELLRVSLELPLPLLGKGASNTDELPKGVKPKTEVPDINDGSAIAITN